jgi:hypothetical protein
MGRINAVWHEANPMPRNPKPATRVAWHLAHAGNCACRPIPEGVLKLIAEAGIEPPKPRGG